MSLDKKTSSSSLSSFFSSSTSSSLNNFKIGLIISLIVQPFEVIRTSSIMSLKANAKDVNIVGTGQTIKKIYELEGIRGFYRGGLLSVFKSTLGAGIFFTGLENVSNLTHDLRKLPYIYTGFIDFCDAGLSKIVTTSIVNPITVLKTRFEVVGCNKYTNILKAVKDMLEKEGIRGFYKGIFPTLIRDVPYSGLQYSSYKWCLQMYSRLVDDSVNPQKKPIAVFITSIISAIFAVMITYPFDNLRVRMQCKDYVTIQKTNDPSSSSSSSHEMLRLIKNVYKEEGLKGFYIGYVPRLMKKATSSMLTWSLYERFRIDKKQKINM